MGKRVIYVHPDDLVEVRWVHPEYEKNATDWKYQSRPSSMLLSFPTSHDIECIDPQVTLHRWRPRSEEPDQ